MRHYQPHKTIGNGRGAGKDDPFQQALQRAEFQLGNNFELLPETPQQNPFDYPNSLPSTTNEPPGAQAASTGQKLEQHIEIIKSLARMQLMSLNQTLVDAFSGSNGSPYPRPCAIP